MVPRVPVSPACPAPKGGKSSKRLKEKKAGDRFRRTRLDSFVRGGRLSCVIYWASRLSVLLGLAAGADGSPCRWTRRCSGGGSSARGGQSTAGAGRRRAAAQSQRTRTASTRNIEKGSLTRLVPAERPYTDVCRSRTVASALPCAPFAQPPARRSLRTLQGLVQHVWVPA